MKLDRRNLLTGLAFGAVAAEAADEGAPTNESLYIPKAHVVAERKFLHDFMDEFSFVDLITATPTLRITHIPSVLDRSKGEFGTVFGHISRNNVQSKTFDGEHSAVIVFRGPHGYISPGWNPKPSGVPTWNFGVVHASGKLQPVADKKILHDMLARLIDKNEDYSKSAYNFRKLPDSYKDGMMNGIIGFEMKIDLIEGKFKLGQESGEADRQNRLDHLKVEKRERSLYDLTAQFYAAHPPK